MSEGVEDLKREVQETKDSVDRLITMATTASADLATVKQQLADAIAAQDPAAIAKAVEDLDAIQKNIDAVVPPPAPPAEPPA